MGRPEWKTVSKSIPQRATMSTRPGLSGGSGILWSDRKLTRGLPTIIPTDIILRMFPTSARLKPYT